MFQIAKQFIHRQLNTADSLPSHARHNKGFALNELRRKRRVGVTRKTSANGTARFLLWSDRMARGFESKSVESQQEESQRAKTLRRALSAEEREAKARRDGLELALAQTQSEMQAACKPAHREMLKLRLEAIQGQIRDL
jgi:hypothetical protein